MFFFWQMNFIRKLRPDLYLIENEIGRCSSCAYLPHSTSVAEGTFSCTLMHCKQPTNPKQVVVNMTTDNAVEGVDVVQSQRNGITSQRMTLVNEQWTAVLEKDDVYKLCPNCGAQFQLKIPGLAMYVYLKPAVRNGPKITIDNLASLLEKQTLSDIHFDVDGEKLVAHSQIVAAASPVLAAMFQEKAVVPVKEVLIKETNAHVFGHFLRYIYTGNAAQLESEKVTGVIGLFAVASKYGVEALKEDCVDCLVRQLSVENAVGVLVAAHLHSHERLYQMAVSFIADNSVDVCSLSDWACLTEEYPDLCIRATQFMLKHLKTKSST